MMGRSIGGGVAVAAAAEQGARALVLETTFSRMTDAAASLYPWLPVRLVMTNRYNSIKRIQQLPRPAVPVPRHGRRGGADRAGPQAVRRVAQRTKQFYEIAYARHNDTPPPAYYAALAQFLDHVDGTARTCRPIAATRTAIGVVAASWTVLVLCYQA